jgi:DNA polymerase-3 subunit epsilon
MKNSFSHDLLNNLRFCIIDLETTGGNPQTDQIFEIGLVRIENLKITEERSFLINPEKTIPEFVQKLTGVKLDEIALAPKFPEVADEVVQFIGQDILVAHNTSFDIPYINAKLQQLSKSTLENKVLCTNVMTKFMIPEIVNSNLEYMSKIFQLGEGKAHKAIDDARMTAKLLLKYLEIFEAKKIKKVNQLYYPRNRFELDRRQFENAEEQIQEIHHLFSQETRPTTVSIKGSNGVLLSVLPLKNPSTLVAEIKDLLEKLPWQTLTTKLSGPQIENLISYNNHFLKMPDQFRQDNHEWVKKYLYPNLELIEKKNQLTELYDFFVTPHLIQGQMMVFSFLNFHPYSQLIFKLPSHKKKVQQFFQIQISRFQESSKYFKKHQFLPEIFPLVQACLMEEFKNRHSLFLKKEEFLEDPKAFLSKIDQLVKTKNNVYEFPEKYLI